MTTAKGASIEEILDDCRSLNGAEFEERRAQYSQRIVPFC